MRVAPGLLGQRVGAHLGDPGRGALALGAAHGIKLTSQLGAHRIDGGAGVVDCAQGLVQLSEAGLQVGVRGGDLLALGSRGTGLRGQGALGLGAVSGAAIGDRI
ncbi:hypothetical protein OG339_48945 (plasmid) [Streptosporangium sp. NBC_01495]|uniref:hypothetical protein n=1 Tax=Streptosporangium sp. NBC_01495 TaxID=2903899 RepID=UPI002E333E91|nr:hypothetical protein [Streptosporangium sp. NBC_01495]